MDAQAPRSPHRYEALPAEISPLELDAMEQAGGPRSVRITEVAPPAQRLLPQDDVAEEGPNRLGGFFGHAEAMRAGVQRATATLLEMAGLQEPEAATFSCPFCLEEALARQRVVFSTCGHTAHGICHGCMVAWVTSLVNDGDISGLVCPEVGCKNGSDGGRARASDAEIRSLLDTDTETLAKYERFLKIQEDDTLRDCPYGCAEMVKPSRGKFGEVVKEMRCHQCHGEFCFHHTNAHVGRPCEEYAREQAQSLRRQGGSSNALQECKCCPHCGINSEHAGGCNHMTCKVCKTHWCWVCGEEIKTADPYLHFREGPCQLMALENQAGGEVFVTAQLLRDRLPCLDVCMAPVHHLLWSSCFFIAIYCPAHFDKIWDWEIYIFKWGLILSIVCCCCDPVAPIMLLTMVLALMLLWPAVLCIAAWALLSWQLRPALRRRYGDAMPDACEYLLLTPALASLACLRFWSGLCRCLGWCCTRAVRADAADGANDPAHLRAVAHQAAAVAEDRGQDA